MTEDSDLLDMLDKRNRSTTMRDFPNKSIPLPVISASALKYLSNQSSSSSSSGMNESAPIAIPKLEFKSLSLDDDLPSASSVTEGPKSPRLRPLPLLRHSSFPLDESEGPETSPMSIARSLSPKPPAIRRSSPSIKTAGTLQVVDSAVRRQEESGLALCLGGESPPKSGTLSPVPPRTPRDRSRSRSPYRHYLNSRADTYPSIKRKVSDEAELAPWDFPNSLRCHPAPAPVSPQPRRRSRFPVKQRAVDSQSSSDIKHQQTVNVSTVENDHLNLKDEICHKSTNADTKAELGSGITKDNCETDELSKLNWEDVISLSSDDEFDFDSDSLSPNRRGLPDSSDIFQETLKAMQKRGSRSSSCNSTTSASDPGDLHVSRASFVVSQMSSITDDDNVFDGVDLQTLEEDTEIDRFEKVRKIRQNWMTTIKNVLEYTKETRKRKIALSAEGGSEAKFNSFSDAAMLLCRSKSARRKISRESPQTRAQISLKGAYHLTKFITAACASTSVGGDAGKLHLLSKGVTKLPQICNNGRMMQRQRRDSLRLVRYMVEEESDSRNSTEVASFKELQNCRYLRTSQRQRRRQDIDSSLKGYNEI